MTVTGSRVDHTTRRATAKKGGTSLGVAKQFPDNIQREPTMEMGNRHFWGDFSRTPTRDFNTRRKHSRKFSKIFIDNRNGARRLPRRLDPREISNNFNAGPTTNHLSGLFKSKTGNIHENRDWKKAISESDPNFRFPRLDVSCNTQGVRKRKLR